MNFLMFINVKPSLSARKYDEGINFAHWFSTSHPFLRFVVNKLFNNFLKASQNASLILSTLKVDSVFLYLMQIHHPTFMVDLKRQTHVFFAHVVLKKLAKSTLVVL